MRYGSFFAALLSCERREFDAFSRNLSGCALCLTILTMLCWGSWANTLKLCPGYRFQLFYWDYVIGMACRRHLLGIDGRQHGPRGTSVPR
jgi:hypothetical protein